jgi:O-antigen ligase
MPASREYQDAGSDRRDVIVTGPSVGQSRAGAPQRANESPGRPLPATLVAPLALPLVLGAFVDLPRLVRSGGWTWLGVAAIAQLAALAVGFCVALPIRRSVSLLLLPIGALVAWAALSLAAGELSSDALPNGLAYLTLAVSVATGAAAGTRNSAQVERLLAAAMTCVDVIGLSIVGISFATSGLSVHHWMTHPRAFAMFALVPFCWHLAQWAGGRTLPLLPAALWIAGILVSLSRMALGAALAAVLMALALSSTRRARGAGRGSRYVLAALGLTTLVAVGSIAPFRERLLKQDRVPLWRSVVASGLQSPVLGGGLGSSQAGPALRYWWEPPPADGGDPLRLRRFEWWEYWAPHPHNEYLRVWHDLGIPGLALFGTALATWLRALYRGSAYEREPGAPGAGTLELAGLLVLVALLLAMATDNPLVYPFVIAPAGLLIGVGLGASLGGSRSRHDAPRER